MIRAAGDSMRPKHDDIRKFPVLGALDRHCKMAALLPEPESRLVANSIVNKLLHLSCRKVVLPFYSTQTIHAVHTLCNDSVSGQRPEDCAEIAIRRCIWQR